MAKGEVVAADVGEVAERQYSNRCLKGVGGPVREGTAGRTLGSSEAV